MFRKIQQIHFVGIGGSGMSGIAEVLLNMGYRVTGSDLSRSETVKRLEGIGGKVFIGHHPSNIGPAQVVVVSSAVSKENPEVLGARERLIPVIPRAVMLAELMRLKYGVAIAGAHGKTTTTSLVASVLAEGGLDPTAVIGGKLNRFGSHAKLGQGELLVAEADESDGSFLKLSPTIAVVTTIDREHLDFYGDMTHIRQAFLDFLNKVPFYGLAVVCLDQEAVQEIIPQLQVRTLTYGMTTQADLVGSEVKHQAWESEFTVHFRQKNLGRFRLALPGLHNVYNALAAIAVGLELEVGLEAVRKALAEFAGVERRFHLVGEKRGVMIVDDYGHHPTEIKATLAAARSGWNLRLLVVFQPHRYSRTRDLLKEFATAFYQADSLILTEIYAAGEPPIEGISGLRLYEQVKQHGHKDVHFLSEPEAIAELLLSIVRSGDILLTLGAGDVWKIGKTVLERL
ncbi:MAG: UDP-N-acetylmuramate--L-alanine ligase [Nitrospirae bacterium]|nr:UDP-N-acetylmuramate--L-alanine ligase [Nitrospirota bacterium]